MLFLVVLLNNGISLGNTEGENWPTESFYHVKDLIDNERSYTNNMEDILYV